MDIRAAWREGRGRCGRNAKGGLLDGGAWKGDVASMVLMMCDRLRRAVVVDGVRVRLKVVLMTRGRRDGRAKLFECLRLRHLRSPAPAPQHALHETPNCSARHKKLVTPNPNVAV